MCPALVRHLLHRPDQRPVGHHQVDDPGHPKEAEVADGEGDEGKQQGVAKKHLTILVIKGAAKKHLTILI